MAQKWVKASRVAICLSYGETGGSYVMQDEDIVRYLTVMYDGDKVSYNIVWTDEARAEAKNKINSRNLYIDSGGNFPFSSNNRTNKITMQMFTKQE